MATQDQRDQLRLHLGERIPAGGSATDTFFSDDELDALYAASPTGGMMGAAFLGWATKAGEYARLVDLNESGAIRTLSQKYRQALTQLKFYSDRADSELALTTTAGRVAGRTIKISDCGSDVGVVRYTQTYNRMPILDIYSAGDYSFVETNSAVYDVPGFG